MSELNNIRSDGANGWLQTLDGRYLKYYPLTGYIYKKPPFRSKIVKIIFIVTLENGIIRKQK